MLAKLERIRAVARAHGVDVKAAALQFALAHPAVVSVIPGSTRPEHANEDLAALSKVIPMAFWNDLRQQGLINAQAPVPTV
ncbi:Pyridoxal 4-dehydrogenase [compost metagenome]